MAHEEKKSSGSPRPPIVVVMGHIDHGKTTLLDFIRKTNVAAKETGGITQHLGAYQITHNEKGITFLDTPGHATFTKMRERGARVADVAILVIAADDSVKPQTLEALAAIKKAEIPFIVAINKIDKPAADIDRVKADLAKAEVLVEGWGGNVPIVGISAKAGTNIPELLDTILLVAEMEELVTDAELPAEGVVIEAHLDSRRGPSATLLITSGSVQKGNFVLADSAFAPVRILETTTGESIDRAGPSSPIRVVGFNKVPAVGARFLTYFTKNELEKNLQESAQVVRKEEKTADVGIMVKADVAGSLEALEGEIQKNIPEGLEVKIFEGGVGEITEGDVKTISSAKKAIIIGFHTKISQNVTELAERFSMSIQQFEIIYEAIDWIRDELKKLAPKKIVRTDVGKLLVLKLFHAGGGGKVVGGRVREGKVPKDAQFEVVRQGTIVAKGTVTNIERNKATAQELKEGEEGGLLVHVSRAIEERDILVFFYEREA